jgi:hypothetical protein
MTIDRKTVTTAQLEMIRNQTAATIGRTALILGLCERTITNYIKSGAIKGFKLGKTTTIPLSQFKALPAGSDPP